MTSAILREKPDAGKPRRGTSFCRIGVLIAGGLMAGGVLAADPLERFWDETKAGDVLRRLPVQVVPENVFVSFGNGDFKPGHENELRDDMFRDVIGRLGPYNCVTLTLRCKPDLSDRILEERAADVIAQAHRDGLQVLMDVDVRIARDEFLRRWPEDAQSRLAFDIVTPTNGVAQFRMVPEFCRDHMCYKSRRVYDVFKSRILKAWAIRVGADGVGDPATLREVTDDVCEGEVACVLSGKVADLAAGERLVVLGEFTHWSADVFSPHLMPFVHELMARYKKVGADGAMHDEWGFPSTRQRMTRFRSFWYSRNFAAAWREKTSGRDMIDDALLMAQPMRGRETERSRAIDTYFGLTYERNVEIETDFYEENKRLWGPDVYVTKHATWSARPGLGEYFHDGLSWWGAKRDWAQSDEDCEVSHCLGMMRTMGGPVWLNEGYGPSGGHYAKTVWRYALAGGRMVYHGIYGGKTLVAGPGDSKRALNQIGILRAGAGQAESRVRLLNLISRAQPVSAAAQVFGHSRLMNWTDPAFKGCGIGFLQRLGSVGYYVDAYPSTIVLTAFRVTDDGYLAAGEMKYPLVVLYRLSDEDRAAWKRLVDGRTLRTEVVETESGDAAFADRIVARLDALRAQRQTPYGKTGLRSSSSNRLPDPDGMLTLLDGTVARLKGFSPDPTGDPIEGTLVSNGTKVDYAATGICAVRCEKGEAVAVAAGALRRLKAPGLDLELDGAQDVVLVKKDGKWKGVMQVSSTEAEIPAALLKLTDDWRKLKK